MRRIFLVLTVAALMAVMMALPGTAVADLGNGNGAVVSPTTCKSKQSPDPEVGDFRVCSHYVDTSHDPAIPTGNRQGFSHAHGVAPPTEGHGAVRTGVADNNCGDFCSRAILTPSGNFLGSAHDHKSQFFIVR